MPQRDTFTLVIRKRDNPTPPPNPFDVELYKSLRAEMAVCMEKISNFQIQKFTLIGGVLAFLLTRFDLGKSLSFGRALSDLRVVATAAFCVIPLLAILLDAQICAFSIQARAISRFLSSSLAPPAAPSAIADWETVLWGHRVTWDYPGEEYDCQLIRFRSHMTVIGATVPTFLLIVLSAAILYGIYGRPFAWLIVTVAGAIAALYFGIVIYVWWKIWPTERRLANAHDKTLQGIKSDPARGSKNA